MRQSQSKNELYLFNIFDMPHEQINFRLHNIFINIAYNIIKKKIAFRYLAKSVLIID